jgi:hypothetical protein
VDNVAHFLCYFKLTLCFSSTVICRKSRHRHRKSKSGSALAYLYCDTRQQHTQTGENIIGSVIRQLAEANEGALETLRTYYKIPREGLRKRIDELVHLALRAMSAFLRVYLVVDSPSGLSLEASSALERLIIATETVSFENRFTFRVLVFETLNKLSPLNNDWPRIAMGTSGEDIEQFISLQLKKRRIFWSLKISNQEWRKNRQGLVSTMSARCGTK